MKVGCPISRILCEKWDPRTLPPRQIRGFRVAQRFQRCDQTTKKEQRLQPPLQGRVANPCAFCKGGIFVLPALGKFFNLIPTNKRNLASCKGRKGRAVEFPARSHLC